MDATRFKTEIFGLKDLLYRVALRIVGNAFEAEDAVQQVMLKLWQKREGLAEIENIKAFVITSLKNECLNRIKKEQTFNRHHYAAGRSQQDFMQPQAGNTIEIIKKEINKLPDKQRLIIQLCDVEGLNAVEAAELLEMESSAVRVNLSRARKKVKEQIIKIQVYEERQL